MGGWSSKPRKGMGTNLSVPNPLGFFPDHQLDPAFKANSENPDWDLNPHKDNWPDANKVGVGAFGLRAYSQLCQQLLLLPPPIGSQEGSLLPYLHL
uniref:Large S protein n=1 Tax=Hepatitis B virus TaxID=10407 RepID=D2X4I9_HBV|nr:large S protein [Hepatitis B virus]ADB55547.1 large S protein [Hepatitis B virus]